MYVFRRNQALHLKKAGFRVTALCAPGPWLEKFRQATGIESYAFPIRRNISPMQDIRALWAIYRLCKKLAPLVVVTHTPKAGLLATIGARFARIPIRFYTVNGLPMLTRSGITRRVLMAVEKLACANATHIYTVSPSLRAYLAENRLCDPAKVRVLGRGGSHGVNLQEFDPARYNDDDRRTFRRRIGVGESACVIGYFGRLSKDKGVDILLSAWRSIREECTNTELLICGAVDETDPISPDVIEAFRGDDRVHWVGLVMDGIAQYYAITDVCVLPSYREGLPNCVLEASAMKCAVVATRIPGCIECVVEGNTGVLTSPGNAADLEAALRMLVENRNLRNRLGTNARALVQEHFSEERLSQMLIAEINQCLNAVNEVRYVPQQFGSA
jgi:glycosyltransferase involved in cell wall biosynthesis